MLFPSYQCTETLFDKILIKIRKLNVPPKELFQYIDTEKKGVITAE